MGGGAWKLWLVLLVVGTLAPSAEATTAPGPHSPHWAGGTNYDDVMSGGIAHDPYTDNVFYCGHQKARQASDPAVTYYGSATIDTNGATDNIILGRIDVDRSLGWTHVISTSGTDHCAGIVFDNTTSPHSIIVMGTTTGQVTGSGNTNTDVFLARYQATDGAQVWVWQHSSTTEYYVFKGRSSHISLLPTGVFFTVCSYNKAATGEADQYVLEVRKHNPADGTIVWTKTLFAANNDQLGVMSRSISHSPDMSFISIVAASNIINSTGVSTSCGITQAPAGKYTILFLALSPDDGSEKFCWHGGVDLQKAWPDELSDLYGQVVLPNNDICIYGEAQYYAINYGFFCYYDTPCTPTTCPNDFDSKQGVGGYAWNELMPPSEHVDLMGGAHFVKGVDGGQDMIRVVGLARGPLNLDAQPTLAAATSNSIFFWDIAVSSSYRVLTTSAAFKMDPAIFAGNAGNVTFSGSAVKPDGSLVVAGHKSSDWISTLVGNDDIFVFHERPGITAVTPSVVPARPGTGFSITIHGDYFIFPDIGNYAVNINASFSTISSLAKKNISALTGTLSAGAGKDLAINVTYSGSATLGFNSTASVNGLLRYAAPTVTGVAQLGAVNGNPTTITITGDNFGGVSSTEVTATVAGLPCGSAEYLSYSHVRCVSGPAISTRTGGGLSVIVTSNDQTGAIATVFSYQAPTVTGASRGLSDGAGVVTIYGANFGYQSTTAMSATVNGAACSSETWVSDTSMTCSVTPGGGAGIAVTVTADSHASAAAAVFSYKVPTVTSSTKGSTDGSTGTITIAGSNFGGTSSSSVAVTVNGASCSSPQWISNTQVACVAPAGSGSGHSVVVTTDSQAGAAAAVFSYKVPTVTSSTKGSTDGSTGTITIDGSNFGGTSSSSVAVTVNGASCSSPQWISNTQVACVAPAGSGSGHSVVVTTDSQAGAAAAVFSYKIPTLSSAVNCGGATVTLVGSNFGVSGDPLSATIDGSATTNTPVYISHTQLRLSFDASERTTTNNDAGSSSPVTKSIHVTVNSQSSTSTSTCVPCQAGAFMNANSWCEKCAAGTFASTALSIASCGSAQKGFYVAGTGATSSDPCVAGSYSDTLGATSCTTCPTGHYTVNGSPRSASSDCIPCPAGSYIVDTLPRVCTPCDRNSYSSSSLSASCTSCAQYKVHPSNIVSGETSDSNCQYCNLGQYIGGTGKDAYCTDCPGLTYSDVPYLTSVGQCKYCPDGYYGNATLTGASSVSHCIPCPAGTVGLRSVCEPCYSGSWCPNNATTPANRVRCPAGKYQPLSGEVNGDNCLDCPVGSSTVNQDGSPSCPQCSPGEYADITGSTVCKLCPIGLYQDGYNSTFCKGCPSDSDTVALGARGLESCRCLEGFYGRPGRTSAGCTACPTNGICSSAGIEKPQVKRGFWLKLQSRLISLKAKQDSSVLLGTYSDVLEDRGTARAMSTIEEITYDVYQCVPTTSCPFTDGTCAEHYTGDACSQCCSEGDVSDSAASTCSAVAYRSNGECLPCPSVGNLSREAAIYVPLVLTLVCGCLGSFCLQLAHCVTTLIMESLQLSKLTNGRISNKIRSGYYIGMCIKLKRIVLCCRVNNPGKFAGMLGRTVRFLQLISVVVAVDLPWPKGLRVIGVGASATNLKLNDILASDCMSSETGAEMFGVGNIQRMVLSFATVMGLVPFLLVQIVSIIMDSSLGNAADHGDRHRGRLLCIACTAWKVPWRALVWSNHAISNLVTLLSLSYIMLHMNSMSVYGCIERSVGDYYLVGEPTIKCYDMTFGGLDAWGTLWTISLIGVLFHSLGIPLLICALLCMVMGKKRGCEGCWASCWKVTAGLCKWARGKSPQVAPHSTSEAKYKSPHVAQLRLSTAPGHAPAPIRPSLSMLSLRKSVRSSLMNRWLTGAKPVPKGLLKQELGFLTEPYRIPFQAWEVYMMLYRGIMVLNVFFSILGSLYQICFLLLVTSAHALIVTICRPFLDTLDNVTEIVSSIAVTMTVFVGLLYGVDELEGTPLLTVFGVLLGTLHVLTGIAILLTMLYDLNEPISIAMDHKYTDIVVMYGDSTLALSVLAASEVGPRDGRPPPAHLCHCRIAAYTAFYRRMNEIGFCRKLKVLLCDWSNPTGMYFGAHLSSQRHHPQCEHNEAGVVSDKTGLGSGISPPRSIRTSRDSFMSSLDSPSYCQSTSSGRALSGVWADDKGLKQHKYDKIDRDDEEQSLREELETLQRRYEELVRRKSGDNSEDGRQGIKMSPRICRGDPPSKDIDHPFSDDPGNDGGTQPQQRRSVAPPPLPPPAPRLPNIAVLDPFPVKEAPPSSASDRGSKNGDSTPPLPAPRVPELRDILEHTQGRRRSSIRPPPPVPTQSI